MDEIVEVEVEDTEEKCRVEMWRCLSKVIEGGLHYIDKPDGLMGWVETLSNVPDTVSPDK